ncbi:hypothetical protein NDU88_008878 [Pleurodeles waltl]|uniref:Uncharacterized protein n=1 Tax=Pleurodeles waltl TaxID=8319 RepID=A0AAV7PQF5_PLEWA|nr:hypothetical protein NDU88_008878 [Pleurodeles waltl]
MARVPRISPRRQLLVPIQDQRVTPPTGNALRYHMLGQIAVGASCLQDSVSILVIKVPGYDRPLRGPWLQWQYGRSVYPLDEEEYREALGIKGIDS